MKTYKCISCGFEKELEKQCNCPECGYKMFPVPYDRRDIFIKEARLFVMGYEISSLPSSFIISPEQNKDENRFPSYERIQDYVCASKTAETFFERLNRSIDNISSHFHELFKNKYKLEMPDLLEQFATYDASLKDGLRILGVDREIGEIKLPKVILDYSETPNDELIDNADLLIKQLKVLCDKFHNFIIVNNMYGDIYKKSNSKFSFPKDKSPAVLLEEEVNRIVKVNGKKYVVDLFSDGCKEVNELEKNIWRAIWTLMNLPILKKRYRYYIESETIIGRKNFEKKLLEIISDRYLEINKAVNNDSFLADKSEENLAEIYDILIDHDVMNVLDINESSLIKVGNSEKELNKLIGLSSIKNSILKIKAFAEQNKDSKDLNLHMCFYGNPGTGKTEVARIIAGILYENKILPINKVIETDRSGMIGQYVGETPQKVMNLVYRAMGGVLFIDEAYALIPGDGSMHDYGYEAVATLIKAMEDNRGKFCVILAGYKNPMEKMLKSNPGFKSRIQFTLDFPNYSREELEQIANLMLNKKGYAIQKKAMDKILDITDVTRKDEDFANAREIRNILDQVIMCQNLRVIGSDDKEITIVDVNKYIKDADIDVPTDTENKNRILSADEELDNLVGLEAVKKVIRKVKAYAKRNVGNPEFNLHMCFYGNPGTGKTEVARILSRILYEAGVLSEAKMVETDAHGLLGSTVGSTAPKTKAAIENAMGGVLFIDEAYALTSKNTGTVSYGDEAISVLLKEMEDKRGKFCTILAGYRNEMTDMLRSNPGFESRIQFAIDFPDYSRDELGEIARKMLNKRHYSIDEEALSRILDIADYEKKNPNYANARTIRNILDQVILNQNLRTEDSNNLNSEIIIDDVEDYIIERGLHIDNTSAENQTSISIDVEKLKNLYYEFEEEIDIAYVGQTIVSISDTDSQGTAFIISPEGICLTCAHCIENSGIGQKARINLLLATGNCFKFYTTFKVLTADKENDIAVIKLDEPMEYVYLPLASSNYKYQPLKEFIMAGYPFGGETYQSVSFTEGKIASVNNIGERKTVFADIFGKPGHSGSPVLDKNTLKVIGIFWGGINKQGSNEMIPCFTPIDILWGTINRICGNKAIT